MRIASFSLLLVAGIVNAQGINSPFLPPYTPVPQYPPGYMPTVPLTSVPLTTAFPTVPLLGISGTTRIGSVTLGGTFYQPLPYYGYGGYYSPAITLPYSTYTPSIAIPVPTPLPNLSAMTQLDKDVAEAEFRATLILQLPAPAKVWLNGKHTSDGSEVTLTSEPLKLGTAYTFRVKAEWLQDNQKYVVERTATVKAGERSRILIVSGDPIR